MEREYIIRKLIEWNPQWNPEKIESWKPKQLEAIYKKEAAKIASQIRINLGLSG